MPDDLATANARTLGSRQSAATGPVDVTVWTANRFGGTLSVLSPPRLGAAGLIESTGNALSYGTDLYVGRGVGGAGAELRPNNVAYHPRLHV
ncbi:Uncharacterised protein [Bordetella ansorpii]|uniref:Uncharacterized protein n=1 Tax=Bordetella ansorpii TaxID=288768 RepID=A0A157SW43_9BORD|nr:hypothetical protein [Bordetella ansorpii]SAI74554.1 Uncharacterised protein [Bordetella ansorpii]